MPRTYAQARKEKWLQELAQGKSSKQIAKEAGCDERTIKRAVREIRSKSAAQEALTQLYQEALRSHMHGMNAILGAILRDLQLPEPYLTEIAWSQIKSPQSLSHHDREFSEVESRASGAAGDPFSDSALLAEHLRNSKAWRALGDWQRSLKKHRLACGRLQIKTLRILAEKTGIRHYSEGGTTTGPLLHAEITGDLLCRTVVQYLLTGKDTLKPEEMRIDPQLGTVSYRNGLLAEGLQEEASASKCQKNILNSLEALKESPEVREMLALFQQLEKTLPKAGSELRAIHTLGVIPGQCRVCRQFGL